MPQRRPARDQALRAFGGRTLLLASLSLVALTAHGAAQESLLRGARTEDEINRQIQPTDRQEPVAAPAATGIPARPYEPVSEGALPAVTEETNGSLFPFEAQEEADGAAGPARGAASGAAARAGTDAAQTQAGTTDDPLLADAEALRAQAEAEAGAIATGGRVERIDVQDEEANRRARPENARVDPIETGTPAPEENPYAPVGLRLGTFDAYATVDQGLRWTSNANSSPGSGEAIVSQTELRLNAVSDWSRHSAAIDLYGRFAKSVSGEEYDEKEGSVDARFVAELGGETTLTAAVGYTVSPESATSPVVIEGAASEPLNHELTGSLGIERSVGKARLGLTGSVERETFSDADLSSGGTLSQEERNYTLAAVALRAGYEVSPALTPFLEAEIGRRLYDLEEDTAGYRRSADRLALSAGVELDLREKLSGEFSVGWLRESFDDDRLEPVSALLLDGTLAWSPWRATTVRFTGSTAVEGSTTADDSGSVLYSGTVEVERQIRPNLTVGALGGLAFRDYVSSSDRETTMTAEANATWWLNRHAGINGRLRHQRFDSTLPARDYDESSVYLGLKLQR
jgi:hypothetical protein